MGTLLYILAIIIRGPLLFIAVVYGLAVSFYKKRWRNGLQNADRKMLMMALAIDKYGNAVCVELFNDLLITKNTRFPFGRIDQTISGVLGLNQREGTLTMAGKTVVEILDFIDKDHCRKAIPKGL